MLNDKDEKYIEKEISSNSSQKRDEDVQINVVGGHNKNYNKRIDSLKVKHKKDKKKYFVGLSAIFAMLSMVMGSSYAYLTMTSKTENSVVINAGTLALTFQNEANVITLEGAVPVSDAEGLAEENEYSFDVKNNGNIPASYKITLDNTCEIGTGVDVCVPDDYIKVGLKIGDGAYKVLEKNKDASYILETASLKSGGSTSYKMKIWLDHNTPNNYNAKGAKNVVYKAKLGLTYEQGQRVNLTLDANGGSIPEGTDWTGSGATATKDLVAGDEYGLLPTPTKTGATFAGWRIKTNLPANKWEQGAIVDTTGQNAEDATNSKRLRLTDYVEVVPSSDYTLKLLGDTSEVPIQYRYILYYDKDFNYISNYSILGTTRTITVPSNCKYVKTTLQHSDDTLDIKMEEINNLDIYIFNKTQNITSASKVGKDANQSLIATWN